MFTEDISIHAPREGGDTSAPYLSANCLNFNPRPPRGGRQAGVLQSGHIFEFQSTPPARGATTLGLFTGGHTVLISIHAPREGGDLSDYLTAYGDPEISIHAPREGGDNEVFVAVI